MEKIAIAIHGGAGTINPKQMTPEKEKTYRDALEAALRAGYSLLQAGASSLDAVEAAVMSLEDCELFNAGRGSVYNNAGGHEMDASIMNGSNLMAGAVSLVKNIKNPVHLARVVMEQSNHVLLAGAGAEAFARLKGVTFCDDSYFHTDFRYQQWQRVKNEDGAHLDHSVVVDEKKFGTVGAVALDAQGHLAAATSTGGMTNKKFGRIGDSPLIGAGCYADDQTCAVSCTGDGEFFIRSVAAYDVACRMAYQGLSLPAAADEVVMNKLVTIGGEGGLIAMDKNGRVAMPFNSTGMYRGFISTDGTVTVGIYR